MERIRRRRKRCPCDGRAAACVVYRTKTQSAVGRMRRPYLAPSRHRLRASISRCIARRDHTAGATTSTDFSSEVSVYPPLVQV